MFSLIIQPPTIYLLLRGLASPRLDRPKGGTVTGVLTVQGRSASLFVVLPVRVSLEPTTALPPVETREVEVRTRSGLEEGATTGVPHGNGRLYHRTSL